MNGPETFNVISRRVKDHLEVHDHECETRQIYELVCFYLVIFSLLRNTVDLSGYNQHEVSPSKKEKARDGQRSQVYEYGSEFTKGTWNWNFS